MKLAQNKTILEDVKKIKNQLSHEKRSFLPYATTAHVLYCRVKRGAFDPTQLNLTHVPVDSVQRSDCFQVNSSIHAHI